VTATGILDASALGRWVEIALGEPPWTSGARFVGFGYLDALAGLSAKGGAADDPTLATAPRLTVRLPIGADSRVLDEDEARARGLPAVPAWLDGYGPQPVRDAAWRRDPALAGKFHASWPDDVPVLVHDGERRRTGRRVEVGWVRVDAVEDGPARPSARASGEPVARRTATYVGTLRSPPKQLTSYAAGARVRFVPDGGGKYPVAVTAAYLDDRAGWLVRGCTRCGLSEGLDPPSTMADADAATFTASCPVCGPSGTRTFLRR